MLDRVEPDNHRAEVASRRIAAKLRRQILDRIWLPGARLPSERDLADQYSVARNTVRQAIASLSLEGLVIARHGKGVYVRERTTPERHGIHRYARSRWQKGTAIHDAEAGGQGQSVRQVYRYLGEVAAPAAVAAAFVLEQGTPVWVRKRTTVVDGRPHQLADSYYPLDLALGTALTQEESGPGGGFARLDEAGDPLNEISEEWAARMPSRAEIVALQLPVGTAVLDLTRVVYDTKGRAVEVMLAVIAADTVRMVYRFPIPD
jgi:GntR family transcriptional regulator